MKRQLKKCKGFNIDYCRTCKRKDTEAELLVDKLTDSNKCIHFIGAGDKFLRKSF